MIPQPHDAEARRETGLSPLRATGARLRHAFGLASAYWTSKDWKFAWFALIVLIAYQFGITYVFVLANRWQQAFYDSIEQRQAARFAGLMLAFAGIVATQVVTSLANTYLQMALSIRWRMFLTERYVTRWMGRNRFAEIERLRIIDNPDQRIADDIGGPTGVTSIYGFMSLVLGFIGAVVGTISFSIILMETAEPIGLTLFGRSISIPGSTVWYAFIYAFLGSLVIARIGQPFIRATMRQQHREGDFRANLIHIRRNAGQIGLSGAVPTERAGAMQTFDQVRHNYRSVIYSTLGLTAGQGVYERIGGILPVLVMVPRYFAGAISFGQVQGARDAFGTLVGNLSFFVQMFPRIGVQIANANRLKALDDAIDATRPRGIAFSAGTARGVALATAAMAVHRPNGASLFDIDDWTVRDGERWVVQGASGAGKSTLLNAIAGLWPDGTGHVAIADRGTVMFVPQRLYLPLGTLKAAICFPDRVEDHDDAAIVALIERVRLGEHAANLHAIRVWQEELSPGEQQRIALARILLHRPTLLVLDEATSALDPGNASYFYQQLLADLPELTLIGVVHDDRLREHHTHCLTIADGRAHAALVVEKQT